MELKRTLILVAGALAVLAQAADLDAEDRTTVDDALDALNGFDADGITAAEPVLRVGQPAPIVPPESGSPEAGAPEADAMRSPMSVSEHTPLSQTIDPVTPPATFSQDGGLNPDSTAPIGKLPAHEVDVAAGVVPGHEEGRFDDRETSTSDVSAAPAPAETATVAETTDPATQADTVAAQEVADDIVPEAVSGPDETGTVRDSDGQVVDAPSGSFNAAVNGLQKTEDGHVTGNNSDEPAPAPGQEDRV